MLSNQEHKDIEIDYIAKGSGAGIRDFQSNAVDFGASDAAMNEEEIVKVKQGVQLLPMTAGEVVLVYNLPSVGSLNLPREVYPQIFLGRIKKWNDPKLKEANPGIELPDMDITVVRRADSSGTTFVLTQHLSAISKEFEDMVGHGKMVPWPERANIVSAPLNLGVAAAVKEIRGAIGYLDYGFASIAHLAMASLQNKEGNYIAPGLEGGQSALASAKIPENMVVWLSDPEGKNSYPITTFTWMLFYKQYSTPEKAAAIKRMILFCLDKGQRISSKFGYIPLPENVIEMVRHGAESIH